jgi:hypothetical protein
MLPLDVGGYSPPPGGASEHSPDHASSCERGRHPWVASSAPDSIANQSAATESFLMRDNLHLPTRRELLSAETVRSEPIYPFPNRGEKSDSAVPHQWRLKNTGSLGGGPWRARFVRECPLTDAPTRQTGRRRVSGVRNEQLRPGLAVRDPCRGEAGPQGECDEFVVSVKVPPSGKRIRGSRRPSRLRCRGHDRDAS